MWHEKPELWGRKKIKKWSSGHRRNFRDFWSVWQISRFRIMHLKCFIGREYERGELLALTPADFNFERKTLRINKSYQRLEGKDVITDPKTPKSNRTIVMSDFLAVEMENFISSLYGIRDDDRIFTISKSYLHHEMDRGAKLAGVKRIRIHGLRHSHISLLINLGFSALAI